MTQKTGVPTPIPLYTDNHAGGAALELNTSGFSLGIASSDKNAPSDPFYCVRLMQAGWSDMTSIAAFRSSHPTALIIVFNPDLATEDPAFRLAAFTQGANVVTGSNKEIQLALDKALNQQTTDAGTLSCSWCGLTDLNLQSFCIHQPLHHIYIRPKSGECPSCHQFTSNLASHLHACHTAAGLQEGARTGVYSLVVVRRPSDGKFLMVQERFNHGYGTPGGGVDVGETLLQGAVRECKEEAGVDVQIKGVVDVKTGGTGSWRRATFYAEPAVAGQLPKTVPDYESAGACWVSLEELEKLHLRADDLKDLFAFVAEKHAELNVLELPDEYKDLFPDFPIR